MQTKPFFEAIQPRIQQFYKKHNKKIQFEWIELKTKEDADKCNIRCFPTLEYYYHSEKTIQRFPGMARFRSHLNKEYDGIRIDSKYSKYLNIHICNTMILPNNQGQLFPIIIHYPQYQSPEGLLKRFNYQPIVISRSLKDNQVLDQILLSCNDDELKLKLDNKIYTVDELNIIHNHS